MLRNYDKNESMFGRVSYFISDGVENISSYGFRKAAEVFTVLIFSIFLINFAIANISNDDKPVNNEILNSDNSANYPNKTDNIDEPGVESRDSDTMVFQNKYVIFEPQEDLSKLNNINGTKKTEPAEKQPKRSRSANVLDSKAGRYTKTQKTKTPEFKKVKYKNKRNQVAESKSHKKWRIRK
ncbi:MAG: hypothetical protein GWM89_07710 [Candidatus Dadabacteria bacterium]|nr:hypothetical protein [Candidatus Dadabacteria bacterium]NIX15558.1 hypothetical protein [Candidatus Dadabacteria bacterium]NIY22298.1 hypothetical protein [Candidatus Dadabacteria bacterium]